MSGIRIAVCALLSFILAACTSVRDVQEWPGNLPEQEYFLRAYETDTANQALQSEAEYLNWIVRFYEGSELMSTGWHAIAESMLFDLTPGEHDTVQNELAALGLLIAAEWAKDNQVRLIDSAMLSRWGAVMQADFAPAARMAAIDVISSDVTALLDGRLTATDIDDERYIEALGISLEP